MYLQQVSRANVELPLKSKAHLLSMHLSKHVATILHGSSNPEEEKSSRTAHRSRSVFSLQVSKPSQQPSGAQLWRLTD